MKAYLFTLLLLWPMHDMPDRATQNAPILLAKVCPDGYDCEALKWGYYKLTKDNP
jgi:hypothetical protein